MRGLMLAGLLWAGAAGAAAPDATDALLLGRLAARASLQARAGGLGQERAADRGLVELASALSAATEADARELRALAGRWGVALGSESAPTLPALARDRRKQEALDKLARLRGPAFDRAFAELEAQETAEDADFLRVARANARAPELQALLERRLAAADHRQREAARLLRRLEPEPAPALLGR